MRFTHALRVQHHRIDTVGDAMLLRRLVPEKVIG